MNKIEYLTLIVDSSPIEFHARLAAKTDEEQNIGREVEIQFSTAVQPLGTTAFAALVIAREA